MPKFRQATPLNSQVITALLLHFKPILDLPVEKNCKGDGASPVPGALVRLCNSLVRLKNLGAQHPLGAEIWSSKKTL